MPRVENTDVSFDVPRDWEDRSVVAFSAPAKPGQGMAANLVMTRDTLAAGEDIRRYGDRQLVEIARRLDGFQLHARQEITLGGQPALELRFVWRGQSGPLEQRIVFVAGRKPAVLSFTATMPKGEAARLNPVFDRILASVKLGQD
ncbi:DcrB-related protein [Sorangium sp. So ce362]|uniref:DcrB-related protein n=1 Tax=Sorangium sp. So ce362 TaxID=3133303 RepID=UPI003F63059E